MTPKLRQRLVQIGLIAVIIAALVGAYLLFPTLRPSLGPSPTPTPNPTPTPIPLPPGKQTYSISTQGGGGIQITEAVFDPLDAPVGSEQTIIVRSNDTVGIASMSATFMGDDGVKVAVPLKLTNGTAKDGIWNASWKVTLPHTRLYSAAIVADNGKKPVTIDLWFR